MFGAYLEIKALRAGTSELSAQQRQTLENYALQHQINIDLWTASKSLQSCIKKLHAGDTLLVSEICCLGKSLSSIKNTIAECIRKKITLIVVCDNYIFDDCPTVKMLLSAIDMVLAINSKLKSQIMRNKVQELRSKGKRFGRPSGSRNKSIKLSGHEQEIAKMLEQKISKTEIARRLGVNRMTLYAFLRQMQK